MVCEHVASRRRGDVGLSHLDEPLLGGERNVVDRRDIVRLVQNDRARHGRPAFGRRIACRMAEFDEEAISRGRLQTYSKPEMLPSRLFCNTGPLT
jgi:hypothetical protein